MKGKITWHWGYRNLIRSLLISVVLIQSTAGQTAIRLTDEQEVRLVVNILESMIRRGGLVELQERLTEFSTADYELLSGAARDSLTRVVRDFPTELGKPTTKGGDRMSQSGRLKLEIQRIELSGDSCQVYCSVGADARDPNTTCLRFHLIKKSNHWGIAEIQSSQLNELPNAAERSSIRDKGRGD